MFYAKAEDKIDLHGYQFEHRLEDIQTLNAASLYDRFTGPAAAAAPALAPTLVGSAQAPTMEGMLRVLALVLPVLLAAARLPLTGEDYDRLLRNYPMIQAQMAALRLPDHRDAIAPRRR